MVEGESESRHLRLPKSSSQESDSVNEAVPVSTEYKNNFQIETHNFKFTKHVSDDRHPSSVVNTSEPLVGVR